MGFLLIARDEYPPGIASVAGILRKIKHTATSRFSRNGTLPHTPVRSLLFNDVFNFKLLSADR
jgi:hypothetical protein